MAKSKAERGRVSSRKKMDAVLRVLRGDALDLVSREAGSTAAKLSEWRDQFVVSGQAGLKSRQAEGRASWNHGALTARSRRSSRLRCGAPMRPDPGSSGYER